MLGDFVDENASTDYTWSPDVGFAEAGPADTVVNRQSADWSAGAVQPAAKDWGDVLKFGFARLVDAKTRPVAAQNTAPQLQAVKGAPAPNAVLGQSAQWGKYVPWVIGGAVVIGGLLLLARRRG